MTDEKLQTSKLISFLEAMIAEGRYSAGDRLPSLRELGRRFNLAPSRVRRNLQDLCGRNILEFRCGSGTYVKSGVKRKNAWNISVALADRKFKSTYCSYALQGIQAVAEKYSWNLHLYFHSYENLRENHDDAMFRACDALILMGCYDTCVLDYLPEKLPGVGLEMHTSLNGRFSTVALDPFDAAEMAAQHFRSLGIRHVKVVDAGEPVYRVRTQLFRAEWGADHEVIGHEDFAHCDVAPDCGYLFVSGAFYEDYARRYFHKTQRVLAENPAVLSMEGKNLIIPGWQPANTIAIDWKKAGEMVADECRRRLTSPGSRARRIYISPVLHLYGQGKTFYKKP